MIKILIFTLDIYMYLYACEVVFDVSLIFKKNIYIYLQKNNMYLNCMKYNFSSHSFYKLSSNKRTYCQTVVEFIGHAITDYMNIL